MILVICLEFKEININMLKSNNTSGIKKIIFKMLLAERVMSLKEAYWAAKYPLPPKLAIFVKRISCVFYISIYNQKLQEIVFAKSATFGVNGILLPLVHVYTFLMDFIFQKTKYETLKN